MASINLLIVFDFDHTIVDGNTDTWITELWEDSKKLMKNRDLCWTDRMANVFSILHEKQFTKEDFVGCLQTLPFTEGMRELLDFIKTQNIECIIISDSNSFFIHCILEYGNVLNSVQKVYTNPAKWTESQLLTIHHYHSHNCKQCPPNLCKGDVLTRHIKNSDHDEKTVLYVGDGKNDFCPALSMKECDFIFPRKGYSLLKLLDENMQRVAPTVVPWTNGLDILDMLKNILSI